MIIPIMAVLRSRAVYDHSYNGSPAKQGSL